MRFTRSFAFAAAVVFTFLFCTDSFGDNRFFLVDQRTQIPIMCCGMPSGWLAGGKSTWTSNDTTNPVTWYVWTQRPDGGAKIFISSQTVFGSSGAISQIRMLQDPRVMAQALLETAKRDHHFTELSLTEAKFNSYEVDTNLRQTRLHQAAERGIRLTQLVSAELFIRYDGRCGSEPRVLYMSLPMLVAESQATAMSRTNVIEIMMPMSFSCRENEAEATMQTLQSIAKSVRINPQYIQIVNHIVSRRVEERIKVMNHIRNTQMEVARSQSETQDRVRDMWSEYIRDVDSVSNPNTGEKMFVDNRYNHAWINGNDEIIYQDSASFNPNQDRNFNRTEWKRLK